MASDGSHPDQPEVGESVHPSVSREPHLAWIPTLVSAVILIGCIAFVVWLHWTIPRLARVPNPDEALARTVQRMLDLEEVLNLAPSWEQWIYGAMTARIEPIEEALRWYGELAEFSRDPQATVYLAILEAEAGKLDRVQTRLASWTQRPPPLPMVARILRAAYVGSFPADRSMVELQARWAEMVPTGWFYDQVAIHLARRASNDALEHATRQAMLERGGRLLWRHRLLAGFELGVLVLGVLAVIVLIKRRRVETARCWPVAEARLPPPWRGATGTAVLIRGGALGSLVAVGLMMIGAAQEPLFRVFVIPLINLPLLALAARFLTGPMNVSMREVMGLRPSEPRNLVPVAVLVVAAGVVGNLVIGFGAGWVEESGHWTEWFDPDLVRGAWPVVAVALLEYIVLAPVFEEVVFRGLVYATLRRVLGMGGAAGTSAMLFAGAHGYSLIGFASVLWSGLLWAWSYEKTGSLWPGIVAHALNNLFVCLGMMAMLRMVS